MSALGLCLWDMVTGMDILILATAILTTMDGIFRFMVLDLVIAILIMVTEILTMDMDTIILIIVMVTETITTTITHTILDEEALPIPME